MQFRELTLYNFKTYCGEHTFSFDTFDEGLYHVTGENRVEPELGANGIGKSNLFDGLFWTLYGKTARGLRAGNIHSWDTPGKTEGVLKVTVEGVDFNIKRSWNPNKLTLTKEDGEAMTVDQAALESFIGLDEQEFQFTVLLGQFTTNFLDYTPTQKLSVFTNVLKLDHWDKLSAEANTENFKAEQEANDVGNKLSREKGWLSAKRSELERLREDKASFAAEMLKSRADIKARIHKLDSSFPDLNERYKKFEKQSKALKKNGAKLYEQIQKINEQVEASALVSNKLKTDIEVKRSEKAQFEALEKKFKKISDKCPSCGQKVSVKHVQKELQDILEKKGGIDDAIDELAGLLKGVKKFDTNELRQQYQTAKASEESATRKAAEVSQQISAQDALRSELNRQLKSFSKQNPFTAPLRDIKMSIASSKDKISSLSKEAKLWTKKAGYFKFWVKEFKLIRLMVVEKALSEFEIEANTALSQLGLSNWSITFDVQRETKGGDISKGFNVLVNSPYTSNAVPWESWSGGENQRLRLAVSMGLMNLVLGKKGIQTNIEVYDEPTQHLSQEGVVDLLTTFRDRAVAMHKRIFVVDHSMLDFGGFSGYVNIIKTQQGSSIQ